MYLVLSATERLRMRSRTRKPTGGRAHGGGPSGSHESVRNACTEVHTSALASSSCNGKVQVKRRRRHPDTAADARAERLVLQSLVMGVDRACVYERVHPQPADVER